MVNNPSGKECNEPEVPLNQNITGIAVEMTNRKHLKACDLWSPKHLSTICIQPVPQFILYDNHLHLVKMERNMEYFLESYTR